MIVFQYPVGKYDYETLCAMIDEYAARLGVPNSEILAIPDDISIQKMDRNQLIEIRNALTRTIDDMFYQPKCQFNPLQHDQMPCRTHEQKCQDCAYFYSDDDARWS